MIRLLRLAATGLIGLIVVAEAAILEAFREDVASGVYDGGHIPSQDTVLLFIGLGAAIFMLAFFLLMTKR
jgi:hypothetical protein